MVIDYRNYFFAPMAVSNTKTTILRGVATYYGISSVRLKADSREREVTYPRYLAMSLMWYNSKVSQVEQNLTIVEIAKMFGKNHATVLHGFKSIAADLMYSKPHRENIKKLINHTESKIGSKKNNK